jgi:hypothetical protein
LKLHGGSDMAHSDSTDRCALQLEDPRTDRRRHCAARIPEAKSIKSDIKAKRLDAEAHSEDVKGREYLLRSSRANANALLDGSRIGIMRELGFSWGFCIR